MPASHYHLQWKFVNDIPDFALENAQDSSGLYFPLTNFAGMMAAITPLLHGDAKTGQNQFLLAPVCAEDLHNSRAVRNFWLYIQGDGPWSATGDSAVQMSQRFSGNAETEKLEAGLLWHKVSRINQKNGIVAEVINFVPANADTVELMRVKITNTGDRPIEITPTAA
ncbi:MAG TPA: cellobiose phosphorylase, partial [Bacillota bacterium]|nr:cellobiose phosphorylase [Bacillota bacterium]